MAYIGAGITRFNTADDLTVTDDAEIKGELSVDGAVDLNTSLNVDGTVTADGFLKDNQTANFKIVDFGASSTEIAVETGGQLNITTEGSNPIEFYTNDTKRTDISGSGVMTHQNAAVFNESGGDNDFRVESDSNAHMFFVDASTNFVAINRSDPQHFLDVYTATSNAGNIRCRADRVAGQNFIHFDYSVTRLGSITGNGSVLTYGGTSDHRLKTNVQTLSGSIDRVKSLNPVTFDWISSGLSAEGFIAHELQSVVPAAVTGEHDEVDDEGSPVYQQVDPRNVVPLLTSALQEALTKIEALEARVAQLEAN